MSIEEIRELLGLMPFDEFAKSKGYGRGCGRTTRAVCAALAAASEGRDAIIAIPDDEPLIRSHGFDDAWWLMSPAPGVVGS